MSNPVPDDPISPAGKPQGTLRDQQATMDDEGPATALPDADGPSDPSVNAASIFEKLEEQAASERGDAAEPPPAGSGPASHPKGD